MRPPQVFGRTRVLCAWLAETVALALLVAVVPAANAQTGFPWMNPSLSPTQRANLVVAQMTLAEKVDLMTGDDPAVAGDERVLQRRHPSTWASPSCGRRTPGRGSLGRAR